MDRILFFLASSQHEYPFADVITRLVDEADINNGDKWDFSDEELDEALFGDVDASSKTDLRYIEGLLMTDEGEMPDVILVSADDPNQSALLSALEFFPQDKILVY